MWVFLPKPRGIPEISIKVEDENSSGVSGASVTLTDGTETYNETTDATGECKLENIPEGTYNITVSCTGYKDYSDEVELTVESADIEVTLEEIETVDITVTVTDGSDPIQDVVVTVVDDEITATTGSAGGCTLTAVPTGVKTITATKEGYTEYSDEVTVTSETSTLSITLTAESSD